MPASTPLQRQAWRLAVIPLAIPVAAPLVLVFSGWLQLENPVWEHLARTLLPELMGNTLVLLAGVGVGTLVLGVGLAWLTVTTRFPGRGFFAWALMLPLAVPAYVLAFVAVGLLDYSGPLQGVLRNWLGASAPVLPPVRSTGGLVAVMTLTLYPYVYLLARAAFLTQGRGTLEAARALGLGPWACFFRVALPMARPGIAAGVALVLMETLADFGTVAVFNYDTFTTAIYKAWFGLFNLPAASQLASLLLLLVALTLTTEQRLRRGARYHETSRTAAPMPVRLNGWRAVAASIGAGGVFLLGFALPVGQLAWWAWRSTAVAPDGRYLQALTNTLGLGASAALITVAAALLLALARRHSGDAATRLAVRIATLGYALPGSVLAVGVMLALTGADHWLQSLTRGLGLEATGPWLSGTLAALLLAYLARFLAVAHGPVDSALERLRPGLIEAARSLGAGSRELLWRIYLPLLRPGLVTAALLVLVDVMKEMPATLLLRPFGWDTLAVRIYGLTAEGEWERAALPALTLVLVSLLPALWLVRRSVTPH